MSRVLIVLVSLAVSAIGASSVDRERAIALATDHLRTWRSVDLPSLKVTAQRCTKPPEDALPADRPRLAHRSFWLVSFTPRKPILGGAYAVYVAADSGEILGSRGYR
jgi:hypothetical protein